MDLQTLEDTDALARRLAGTFEPGTRVALTGTLGAGKTTFAQRLAAAWGVHDPEAVVSPTYALVHEYPGSRGPFVHIDFYRLDEPESVYELGLEEQLARSDALVVVEWADKFPDAFDRGTVWVRFSFEGGRRRVMIEGAGQSEA